MRTGNKGYTLFELMVSVAIFALVMVGIISLMRTSSVFYLGGQNEIRLQEEAQIAMNQIEDLLIDTNDKVVAIDSTDKARVYSVHKADGVYGLKQSGDQLFYKKLSSGTIADDEGWVLMADGVENFVIDGIDYTGGGTRNSGDNCVAVKLDFSNGKYEYEAKRDVHFRNPIENKTPYSIPTATSEPDSTEGVTFDFTYRLRRGEKLNLFTEFGIVDLADTNSDGVYDEALKSLSSKDVKTYYKVSVVNNASLGIKEACVETSSSLETVTESVIESYGLYVSGKNSKGEVVNVQLLTDPVSWVEPVPYFFLETHCSQNEGSPVWVEFRGVDLRGVTDAKFTMKLLNQNGGQIPNSSTVSASFGQSGGRLMSEGGSYGDQARILLSAEACDMTGFLKIYQKNDVAEGADAFVTKAPRYLEVAFEFNINGKPVDGSVKYRLSTLSAGVLD